MVSSGRRSYRASIAGAGEQGLPRLLLAGLAGLVPIYALGATWLALQLDMTPGAAVLTGVVPFVWLDVLKAVAAALTARAWSACRWVFLSRRGEAADVGRRVTA